MWGNTHRLGNLEGYDLLEDALKNTEMIVFWSSDPDTTQGRRLRRLRVSAVAPVAQGPRGQDGLHRSLLQPHRRHDRRQVAGSSSGHGRPCRTGHRVRLADRGPVRQGVCRRLTRSASTNGRTTSSARPTISPRPLSGRRRSPGCSPATSALWPASGPPRRPCWPRAVSPVWAAPPAALRATSGPASMIALIAMQGMGKPGINLWSTSYGSPLDTELLLPGIHRGRHLRRPGEQRRRQGFRLQDVPPGRSVLEPASFGRGLSRLPAEDPGDHDARAS